MIADWEPKGCVPGRNSDLKAPSHILSIPAESHFPRLLKPLSNRKPVIDSFWAVTSITGHHEWVPHSKVLKEFSVHSQNWPSHLLCQPPMSASGTFWAKLSMMYGRKVSLCLEERMVSSPMEQGPPKNKDEHQGSQSGIVSLGSSLFQSQTVLWTGPFLAFHYRHLLLSWPQQGSTSNWRQWGKVCQTDG